MRKFFLFLGLSLVLAACGVKGDPQAPGSPSTAQQQ